MNTNMNIKYGLRKSICILLAGICILAAGCGKPKPAYSEPVSLVEPMVPETIEANTTVEEPAEANTTAEEPAEANTTVEEPAKANTSISGQAESEPDADEETTKHKASEEDTAHTDELAEDGKYTAALDVAAYINAYGHLPSNFITKKEAGKLGWEGGSLEPYAPGMCIGGDYFGNYEGLLPTAPGREYHECDIDTLGKSKRGAKRLIYSNDGLIYYTSDHYASFTLLYGDP